MFTGIIEEIGRIHSVSRSRVQRMTVESKLEVSTGDSIAIQGICLTVTDTTKTGFAIEVMKQTLGRTTLPTWRAGDYLNLERALRVDSRLGGHIILGHVDDVAQLRKIKSNEYFFEIDPDFSRYVIPRGSVGIDGASLTVSSIADHVLSVSLIPYTLENTTLGRLRPGARVNVEYDHLVKILRQK